MAAALGLTLFVIWLRYKGESNAVQVRRTAALVPPATVVPNPGFTSSLPPSYPQIDVNALSQSEISTELRRRGREDARWEWKTPIRFLGRVVDEKNSPVTNANIHFQWTDLSARGISEADTISDANGLFSLDNVQGKRLLVRVKKEGFYPSGAENRLSFEFADPREEIYHYGATREPLTFRLHRKGEGQKMVVRSAEVISNENQKSSITIAALEGPIGELQIKTEKPVPAKPMSPHYDWNVELKLPGGGFVETTEEFGFEAPEVGYSPVFRQEMPAAANNWNVAIEKTLYFVCGEPKKYGRLTFRTSANSRYVFVDYVINPSGSRNLEYDPAKAIKTK